MRLKNFASKPLICGGDEAAAKSLSSSKSFNGSCGLFIFLSPPPEAYPCPLAPISLSIYGALSPKGFQARPHSIPSLQQRRYCSSARNAPKPVPCVACLAIARQRRQRRVKLAKVHANHLARGPYPLRLRPPQYLASAFDDNDPSPYLRQRAATSLSALWPHALARG